MQGPVPQQRPSRITSGLDFALKSTRCDLARFRGRTMPSAGRECIHQIKRPTQFGRGSVLCFRNRRAGSESRRHDSKEVLASQEPSQRANGPCFAMPATQARFQFGRVSAGSCSAWLCSTPPSALAIGVRNAIGRCVTPTGLVKNTLPVFDLRAGNLTVCCSVNP